LRFIVWSFPRARLQFTLDQFKGATSRGQEAAFRALKAAPP
jgi:hypothetical protein